MNENDRRSQAGAKPAAVSGRRYTPVERQPAFGRGIVVGIVSTLVLGLAVAFGLVELGLVPANADAKPSSLESWAAHTSLNRTIAREDADLAPPAKLGNGDLASGVKLYAANCAFCHGTADGKASLSARGFYVPAPQLAADGVEDDPAAVTFWKLKHGIRFTAMPAFGGRLSDAQLWKITAFVKTMDSLPIPVEAEWKAVPSAAEAPATTAPEPAATP